MHRQEQGLRRGRRYTRRQVVGTTGKGVAGAAITGGLLTPPWAGQTRAAQGTAEITWGVQEDVDMEFRQEAIVDVLDPWAGTPRDRARHGAESPAKTWIA